MGPREERVETVVIGGGQAGLAVGHHLAKRGLPFVILDANERIGNALEVSNVVWCTGFRPDFSWIHLDIFGTGDNPMERTRNHPLRARALLRGSVLPICRIIGATQRRRTGCGIRGRAHR